MATENVNYTPAQEALIRAAYAEKGAPLNFDDCKALADNPAMNDSDGNARKARSITAKISRMADVEYKAKEPVSKTGEPVVRKSDLVAQIAAHVEGNLDGLDKAPKAALVAISKALAA